MYLHVHVSSLLENFKLIYILANPGKRRSGSALDESKQQAQIRLSNVYRRLIFFTEAEDLGKGKHIIFNQLEASKSCSGRSNHFVIFSGLSNWHSA